MIKSNTIYFSRRLKDRFPHIAREIETKLKNLKKEEKIEPKWLDHTYDIWARDYMPLQLETNLFVHYIYYPDYLLRTMENRSYITNPIKLEQQLLIANNKEIVNLPLILDGGNVVTTPRHIIMTEKVLEENKRGYSKKEIEQLIRKTTGLEPLFIIWDKRNEPYGHIDWLVRYLGDNKVIVAFNEPRTAAVSKSAYDTLKRAGYEVEEFRLESPEENSWAYLNYVQVNDIVLMPTVCTDADSKAIEHENKAIDHLQKKLGPVTIIPIDCQDLVKEGGALHCISWDIQA